MKIDDESLKHILLEQNYVKGADLKKAQTQATKRKMPLLDYLLENNIITRTLLGQAIAEAAGLAFYDLASRPSTKEQVMMIPAHLARRFGAVVVKERDNTITIASDSPTKRGIKTAMRELFPHKKIIISYSLPEDIEENFIHYRKELKTRFGRIIKKQRKVAPEIIEEIFRDAIELRASDIHFEPQENEVIIRFRIDGVLREAARIHKEHFENVLNRIKVMAHLRIDEHFAMQDGAIRYEGDGKMADMRVSIVPTVEGEKVEVRLLAEYVKKFALSDLGMDEKEQDLIMKAAKTPFGMILVTGPTGSGKTTTLYSILRVINNPEVNITTIEDPVEYKIEGANHIQVNPAAGITFAKGLRSIVRQDPDIILVGEIRDKDTAQIAVNAALTGHLLFSSFHANDSATAIPRLLEMGIEPFLLSSTLEIIVAQRLARRICNQCRYSVVYSREKLKRLLPNPQKYFSEGEATLYRGKGCTACNESGYKGRIGIFEIIPISREMRNLIMTDPSADQVWQLARKERVKALFDDGVDKVKNGVTTLEELLRVATPRDIQ